MRNQLPVMIVGIVLLFFVKTESHILRVVIRIALLPIIAGISYEIIRVAGSSDHPVVNFLSKPGLMLQRLTTKEPDDSMIEVAIASVEAVLTGGLISWRISRPDRQIRKKRRRYDISGSLELGKRNT